MSAEYGQFLLPLLPGPSSITCTNEGTTDVGENVYDNNADTRWVLPSGSAATFAYVFSEPFFADVLYLEKTNIASGTVQVTLKDATNTTISTSALLQVVSCLEGDNIVIPLRAAEAASYIDVEFNALNEGSYIGYMAPCTTKKFIQNFNWSPELGIGNTSERGRTVGGFRYSNPTPQFRSQSLEWNYLGEEDALTLRDILNDYGLNNAVVFHPYPGWSKGLYKEQTRLVNITDAIGPTHDFMGQFTVTLSIEDYYAKDTKYFVEELEEITGYTYLLYNQENTNLKSFLDAKGAPTAEKITIVVPAGKVQGPIIVDSSLNSTYTKAVTLKIDGEVQGYGGTTTISTAGAGGAAIDIGNGSELIIQNNGIISGGGGGGGYGGYTYHSSWYEPNTIVTEDYPIDYRVDSNGDYYYNGELIATTTPGCTYAFKYTEVFKSYGTCGGTYCDYKRGGIRSATKHGPYAGGVGAGYNQDRADGYTWANDGGDWGAAGGSGGKATDGSTYDCDGDSNTYTGKNNGSGGAAGKSIKVTGTVVVALDNQGTLNGTSDITGDAVFINLGTIEIRGRTFTVS